MLLTVLLGLALLDKGDTTQLLLAQMVTFTYLVLVLNYAPFKKDAADLTNQVANIQIFISLMGAMALKTQMPLPGSMQSILLGKCTAPRW